MMPEAGEMDMEPIASSESMATRTFRSLRHRFLGPLELQIQLVVDRLAPHVLGRWLGFAGLLGLYGLWMYMRPGWFIVTYGLGIFLLNQLVGFVTPLEDPSASDGRPLLPVNADDSEAKPLQTKLPELKFWQRSTRGIVVAFFCTLLPFMDIPVFWPILLLYFLALLAYTCRRQVSHMIRWGYVPFAGGKRTYKGLVGGMAESTNGPKFADRGITSAGRRKD